MCSSRKPIQRSQRGENDWDSLLHGLDRTGANEELGRMVIDEFPAVWPHGDVTDDSVRLPVRLVALGFWFPRSRGFQSVAWATKS
jgi:hypothetical protein